MFCLQLTIFLIRLILINLGFITKFLIIKFNYLAKIIFFLLICLYQTKIIIYQQPEQVSPPPPMFNPSPLIKKIKLQDKIIEKKLQTTQDLEQLKNFYQQKLSYQATHRDLLFNLGIIALYQNQEKEAAAWFKKSHYQDPNNQIFKDNSFLLEI